MALENFRTQKIIWDKANRKIFEAIEANSGDSNGRKLVVQVINQETTENLFGTTLSLGWKSRKGAKGLDAFNVVDASKGIFEIYYTTEMLSNIGNIEASLILINSSGRIESSTFTISVRPSTVDDESVESENSFTALTEALVKVNDFEAQLAQKPNHDTVWSMANMGQDIKESWTNGAVAVVDVNSVQKINLTDSAVGVEKLDGITSDLIGLDKVQLDWLLGAIQSGSINELSKNAASMNNFIVLDKPLTIELLNPNYVFNVFYYELNGTYLSADTWSENKRTIPFTENRKIRISVRYADSRIFEDIYPLINDISIIKQHTSLKNVNEKTQQLDIRQNKIVHQLVGVEKHNFDWVHGRIQNGQLNPNSLAAVSTNFIQLNDELELSLSGETDYKFGVYNYGLDNSYINFDGWRTDKLTIKPNANRKIRIAVAYNDDRVFNDIVPLLQSFSILKQKENTSDSVPLYWEPHLQSKINTIKTHQKRLGWDGTSFVFITDVHWNSNAQKSPMLLSKVVSECDIPYILDGGDINANPLGVSKEDHLKETAEYKQAFSSLDGRILRTLGNHDDNSINGLFSETITDLELYDAIFRQNSKYPEIVSGKTGKYHYIDDTMHKVRYITLDALDIPYVETANDGLLYGGMTDWAFRQEQVDWFTNKALAVPDNEWGVVVVSHIPINYGYIKNDNLVMNALQAFKDKTTYSNNANVGTDFEASVNVDYSNGGGEVYCWLAGHVHLDMTVELPTNISFPQILTLNDNLHSKDGAPVKTLGTTSEQAFDVITIDKVNRKLLFTRIGAGSDRVFDY